MRRFPFAELTLSLSLLAWLISTAAAQNVSWATMRADPDWELPSGLTSEVSGLLASSEPTHKTSSIAASTQQQDDPTSLSRDLMRAVDDAGLWAPAYVRVHGDGGGDHPFPERADNAIASLSEGLVSVILDLEKFPSLPDALSGLLTADEKLLLSSGDTAHIYISSANAAALANHTDETGILARQLAGRKAWSWCAPNGIDSPDLRNKLAFCREYTPVEMALARLEASSTNDCARASTAPGDLLYLPRGTIHSARAADDQVSIHLTMGIPEARVAGEESARARRLTSCTFPNSDNCKDGVQVCSVEVYVSDDNGGGAKCPKGTSEGVKNLDNEDAGFYLADSCDDNCGNNGNCNRRCNSCTGCAACVAGKAASAYGQSECATCAAGRYSTDDDAVTWQATGTVLEASQGKNTGVKVDEGAQRCAACGAGYYSEQTGGANECQGCNAGKYSINTNAGNTACSQCNAGKYSDTQYSTTCADCARGKWSDDEANICTPCDIGEYELNNDCYPCANGEWSAQGAYDSCTPCGIGKFRNSAKTGFEDSSCVFCDRGTWSREGAIECTPCGAGKYGDLTDGTRTGIEATECKDCDAFFYAAEGSTGCTPCGYTTAEGDGLELLSQGEALASDSHFRAPAAGQGSSSVDCLCVSNYAGYNCHVVKCGDSLPGFSLGAMFLMGSDELHTEGDYTDDEVVDSVRATLTTLLGLHDIDSDRTLTYAEMKSAVESVNIEMAHLHENVTNITLPTWSTPKPRPSDTQEYYLIIGDNHRVIVSNVTINSLYWTGDELDDISIADARFNGNAPDSKSEVVTLGCIDGMPAELDETASTYGDDCHGWGPLVIRFTAPAGVRRVLIKVADHGHDDAGDNRDYQVVLATDKDGDDVVWSVNSNTAILDDAVVQEYDAWSDNREHIDYEHFFHDFEEYTGLDGYGENDGPVSIDFMVEQAMLSFRQSGTFDFTSNRKITDMTATRPKPSWDDTECGDSSNGDVTVSWEVDDATRIYKQCGYVNGIIDTKRFYGTLVSGLSNTADSNDNAFEIADERTINAFGYRRIYCIMPIFCGSNVICTEAAIDWSFSIAQCAVGIRYDGAPLDLRPSLTSRGVGFSMLDTATGDVRFDVYRSDRAKVGASSVETRGKLVVGVPYSSRGCGRVFSPIYLVDTRAAEYPGRLFEYGAQAIIQEVEGSGYVTSTTRSSMTKVQYRVPWLSELDVEIEDEYGKKVDGVTVSVCKLDKNNNVDSYYCPLVTGETDVYGEFNTEIRVTDIAWTAKTQHFRVTPSKITGFENGTFVNHTFDPPFEVVAINHLGGFITAAFIDETAVSISGLVHFDYFDW